MASIVMLCGPVGSGKSTHARRLEREGHVVFSLDEWMLQLFGDTMSREEFDDRTARCTELILRTAGRLAAVGVDSVLDFGFWRRAERERVRARIAALGATPRLVVFDVPREVRAGRIAARNQALPPNTFAITPEMLEAFDASFEPPAPEENPVFAAGPSDTAPRP